MTWKINTNTETHCIRCLSGKAGNQALKLPVVYFQDPNDQRVHAKSQEKKRRWLCIRQDGATPHSFSIWYQTQPNLNACDWFSKGYESHEEAEEDPRRSQTCGPWWEEEMKKEKMERRNWGWRRPCWCNWIFSEQSVNSEVEWTLVGGLDATMCLYTLSKQTMWSTILSS